MGWDDFQRNRRLARLIAFPFLLLFGVVGLGLWRRVEGCAVARRSFCSTLLTRQEVADLTRVPVDGVRAEERSSGCSAAYLDAAGRAIVHVRLQDATRATGYERAVAQLRAESGLAVAEAVDGLDGEALIATVGKTHELVVRRPGGGTLSLSFYAGGYQRPLSLAEARAVVPLLRGRIGKAEEYLKNLKR